MNGKWVYLAHADMNIVVMDLSTAAKVDVVYKDGTGKDNVYPKDIIGDINGGNIAIYRINKAPSIYCTRDAIKNGEISDVEKLARFLNLISNTEYHYDTATKKIQNAYKKKAEEIIVFLKEIKCL